MEAVISQAESNSWDDLGGPGSIDFARPGTLVIHNRESVLMEVLDLLETYRMALRSSKPRDRDVVDPQEVVTVYYRLHANVADGLLWLLPQLVQPESWKSQTRPEAKGETILVASTPELFGADGQLTRASAAEDLENAQSLVVSRAVLIIRQTRPPYTEWSWKSLGVRIGGPHMIRLPDGRFVAVVRLYDGAARTSVCWLDPIQGTLSEALKLPSGGDTSYAGMVWHEGKTSIYLAKVRFPNGK